MSCLCWVATSPSKLGVLLLGKKGRLDIRQLAASIKKVVCVCYVWCVCVYACNVCVTCVRMYVIRCVLVGQVLSITLISDGPVTKPGFAS